MTEKLGVSVVFVSGDEKLCFSAAATVVLAPAEQHVNRFTSGTPAALTLSKPDC